MGRDKGTVKQPECGRAACPEGLVPRQSKAVLQQLCFAGAFVLADCWCPLLMSAFDVVAPRFDSFRALPAGVAEAIRAAILKLVGPSPRLLDLGAGSGRIGATFVAAGDDYVGIDLSSGMLREFAARTAGHGVISPRLVQADGRQLPFRDAT